MAPPHSPREGAAPNVEAAYLGLRVRYTLQSQSAIDLCRLCTSIVTEEIDLVLLPIGMTLEVSGLV